MGYIQRRWVSKVNEVSNPSVRVVTIEEQSGLGSISPMVSLETNPYPHNAIMTFCRESKCKSRAELAKLAWAIMPRCSFASVKIQIFSQTNVKMLRLFFVFTTI